MKMIILNKQKHDEPEFDELYRMLSDLKDFLDEDANPNNREWRENFKILLDFQDSDGSFKFLDSYNIPSDARVDFCHMPTYICTAILMKAYMTNSQAFTSQEESALFYGLKVSCARNLSGHGYEGLIGQIDALNVFMKAGLKEFMDLHQEFCPEFSEMIEKIISEFNDMESQGKFYGSWGESYESEIKNINKYFSNRNVFVYGTLMNGEANHSYLNDSTFLGNTMIEGYDMYDVGFYPAIIPGNGIAIGELYQVPKEDMPSIDMLEGEGTLYTKKCETVTDSKGNTSFAFVYVYLRDCSDLKRISAWNEDYVWYVSYGSNMLNERFMCYIEGGSYKDSARRKECEDTTPPIAVKTLEIPYDIYFGNHSRSWQNGGVSFLDVSKEGHSLGVAYLITEKQFNHVAAQENNGIPPHRSNGWYTDIIDLGIMNGFEVKTITNRNPRPHNNPSDSYISTLMDGIRENWPEMSDEEIRDYINNCMDSSNNSLLHELENE